MRLSILSTIVFLASNAAFAGTHINIPNSSTKNIRAGFARIKIACIDQNAPRPKADWIVHNDTTDNFSFLGFSASVSCVGAGGSQVPPVESNRAKLQAIDGGVYNRPGIGRDWAVYPFTISVDYALSQVTATQVMGSTYVYVFQCQTVGSSCSMIRSTYEGGSLRTSGGMLLMPDASGSKISISIPGIGMKPLERYN